MLETPTGSNLVRYLAQAGRQRYRVSTDACRREGSANGVPSRSCGRALTWSGPRGGGWWRLGLVDEQAWEGGGPLGRTREADVLSKNC